MYVVIENSEKGTEECCNNSTLRKWLLDAVCLVFLVHEKRQMKTRT